MRESRKGMIMIMMMLLLLLLQVVILCFFVTLSLWILYLMRACGLLIVVLHCTFHQGRNFSHLTLLVILECWRWIMMVFQGCWYWWCLFANQHGNSFILLRGVKHAFDVRFNMIFVHLLNHSGYNNHFGPDKWSSL